MKKLGLIGGMGPESTLSYYHGINYGYQSRNPQGSFPPLVLESVNIFEMLSFCRSKDYDGLTAFLLRAIQNTAAAARTSPPWPPIRPISSTTGSRPSPPCLCSAL